MKKLVNRKKYNAKQIYGKDKNIMLLLGISLSLSIILFIIGLLLLFGVARVAGDALNGMDFIVFGLLTSIGPIGFYNHLKAKKKREMEEQLPDFLREISSSTSSGMTIFDAIKSSASGDHGRLTPELEKMASQLSWGISVKEALDNFAKRMNTPSVKRMAVTINQALETGGNTSSVFEAAAKEIDQVKLVEEQRKAEMSLYAIVIFISFFVFLAVILIIDQTIFAAIFDVQANMPTTNANIANTNLQFGSIDPIQLKNTFFSFVLVQSIGGGLLGGFMMDGKISSGVRFAFVLILVSFFVFKFMF
jgi:flagellar protein FlaJ